MKSFLGSGCELFLAFWGSAGLHAELCMRNRRVVTVFATLTLNLADGGASAVSSFVE